jgi:putative transposase
MPRGLHRYHQSQQTHFITFSCYRRQARFDSPDRYDLFLQCLEETRRRFAICVYGYVVMPEHVHLLLSEPPRCPEPVLSEAEGSRERSSRADLGQTLADAMRDLKLSFSKRVSKRISEPSSFWQKRYYDRNIRDEQFTVKLRYIHRNPVKRGLVSEPVDWKWSSFRHYALREMGAVEIESEWTARDREANASERVFLCS